MFGFVSHIAGSVVNGLKDGAKDVGHAASSVAKTVDHAVTGAVKTGEQAAGTVAHAASSAANSLFDKGEAGFKSLTNEAGSVASSIGSGVSKAAGALGDVGSTIGHDLNSAYHTVRHDLKEGAIDASNLANKVGLGSLLDKLGVGGVNQKDVQKNHQITDTYAKQSKDLQSFLGPGAGNNWATYASWASDRAGQAIQNKDDPGGRFARDANQLVSDLPKPVAALGGLLGLAGQSKASQYNKEYENESTQAAKGNQKVFADISPPLQQLMDNFKGDSSYNQGKWDKFAGGLKAQGKDPMLISGLNNYYKAKFQTGDQKAQSVTLGNLQLGLHEQRYLQPQIEAAFPPGQGATYTPQASARIGDNTYNLSKNLPENPHNGGQAYSPGLQNITNPELKQFVQQYGPSGGGLQGSGAADWTNLSDRMKFISGLFLSTYSDPSLMQNPRTA